MSLGPVCAVTRGRHEGKVGLGPGPDSPPGTVGSADNVSTALPDLRTGRDSTIQKVSSSMRKVDRLFKFGLLLLKFIFFLCKGFLDNSDFRPEPDPLPRRRRGHHLFATDDARRSSSVLSPSPAGPHVLRSALAHKSLDKTK